MEKSKVPTSQSSIQSFAMKLEKLEKKLSNSQTSESAPQEFKELLKDFCNLIYFLQKKNKSFSFARFIDEKFKPLSRSMHISEILLKKITRILPVETSAIYWRYSTKSDPSAFIRLGKWTILEKFEKNWIIQGEYEKKLLPFLNKQSFPYEALQPIESNPLLMIDKKAYIFRFTHQNRDGGFLILIPQIHELDHLKPEVIKKIEQICQTISIYLGFLNKNQSVDNTYKDLFVHIEQFVRTLINNNIKEGKKATLSLFQFHSFDRYFAGMGKNFSRELLHDISQIFRSRLKKNDLLFIFSPEEYLLISLDSSPEEIRNRFPQKSFSVKGLIMTFSYNTATYDKTILMSQDLWSKLYYS